MKLTSKTIRLAKQEIESLNKRETRIQFLALKKVLESVANNKKKIGVGDTVVLRSGGPLMTVRAISDKIDTVWYDERGEYMKASFSKQLLAKP